MQIEKPIETFYPSNKQEWRDWLEVNHDTKLSIWVIFYKKSSNIPTITWSESVDEALCYGWIDSVKKSIDSEKSIQFFSRRKPNSTWSKINKEKIKSLIENGKMTEAGLKCIEIAKQNGTWTILDEVEELIIPKDLESAFDNLPGSMEFFQSLTKTSRKVMLQWIVMAKQNETRQKRILEIATSSYEKLKPKQFRF
jgi:uncharacterized protein YdeI (YjbR/CyaY-like superfamily)